MSKLSIGTAWDQTRETIGRDGKAMMAIALAAFMLPMALNTMINPASATGQAAAEPSAGAMLVNLLLNFVVMIGSLAITAIALNKSGTVGEALVLGAKKLLPVLGASLLLIIPAAIVFSLILGPDMLTAMSSGDEAAMTALMTPDKALYFLLFILLMLAVGVKLMVMTPVAVAETNNPITMITRSWSLTGGHYFRLLAYILLMAVAAMLVILGGVIVAGVVILLIFGQAESMSLSALFLGLAIGFLYSVLIVIFATMTAKIYSQLATEPGVPEVEAA